MSARSRRALANLEKRIQKFIDTAFFWPVEVGKILMRLLIVILNKLVRIISRRNRLVSKIALGDHLVGWSSIRGSIFRRIGYDQGGYSLFLTRARARGVRGYFWDSGSFRRRAGCGRRFCDFRKRFIFARIETVSIPLYAGGRPVLRNICKIAKFVDTAENESKEAFLIWNVSMTPYGATWTHMGLHYFIDFMSEASVDWGRIVVAKPASPVFMISHMNGLEAQISSIFRRFQREEMEFNCCCSIDSPVFLRWKWLKTHIFGICCVFQSKKSESIFVCNIDSVIICCWKCLCIWI